MDKIDELKNEISKLSDNALNKLLDDEIENRSLNNDIKDWSVVRASSIMKDYGYKSPLENLKKSFVANSSNNKVVIIDPIGEYEEFHKYLCLEKGEIIKLDNSKSGFLNSLDLGIENGSLDEKETGFRSLMDSVVKSESQSQVECIANLFLEMAERQKESIRPDWYSRIVELCNEYLN